MDVNPWLGPKGILTVVLVAGLMSSGCGGTANKQADPAPNVTVTVTSSAVPTPTVTASSTVPSVVPTTASASGSPTGPINVAPGAQRSLAKADAFISSGWVEGSYRAVGQTQDIQAIAYEVGCYKSEMLEFRFAQNQGNLTIKVAQAMSSPSSGNRLEWALIVDGRQVQTKTIAFKESAELKTDLAGVAVVKLQVNGGSSTCSGRAIGLVTSAVIQG